MTDIDRIPTARPMGRERRAAIRALLEEKVRQTRRPWWRRSWQSLAVGGGAVTLVLASGAAAAYVAFRPADDKASVVCYSAADLDAESVPGARVAVGRVMTAHDRENATETVTIDDPVAACVQAWQDGLLSTEGVRTVEPDPAARHEVPPLVACTLDEGVAGVFPGSPSTCERLNLPQTTRSRP
jgi:hypothetical protein